MEQGSAAPASFLLLLLLLLAIPALAAASLGVDYGRIGNNLPPPTQVVSLLRARNLGKVRIYDTNPDVLSAFQNSGIKLIVGAENGELESLARNGAQDWVRSRIVPYASSIETIAVGNEVLMQATSLSAYLYPAIANVNAALKEVGLDTAIKVSTTHAMDVIASDHAFPPSAGAFAGSIQADMAMILSFLSQTGAPFLANVFPYFAYIGAAGQIPLEYALFQPTPGVDDGSLHYSNLYDAQVDTLISAMEALGYGDIDVVVSESGWPHEGGAAATVENAKAYNGNLIPHLPRGTPKRPGRGMSAYIFSLFDENLKMGAETERHFGIYDPTTQTPFYDLPL